MKRRDFITLRGAACSSNYLYMSVGISEDERQAHRAAVDETLA